MADQEVKRTLLYITMGLMVFCVSAIMLARTLVY